MACSLATLIFSLLFGLNTGSTCELGSSTVSESAYLESDRYKGLPADEWAWVNNDLMLARLALANGDPQRAETIGRWLDYAIELRLDTMNEGRGERRVKALHGAVSDLITGGQRPGSIAGFKGSSSEISFRKPGGRAARSVKPVRARSGLGL